MMRSGIIFFRYDPLHSSTHGTTYVYFGVVMHVCGVEGLACKARDPITELVVTCRDEESILTVKDVEDVKSRATSITLSR